MHQAQFKRTFEEARCRAYSRHLIFVDIAMLKIKAKNMNKKQPIPKLRSDGKVTRDRILLAAEELFSKDGFSGVSLRKITGEAGVDLALIKYYFGS